MIKIAIIMPCWGRPDILKVVLKQMDHFIYESKQIEYTVIYVVSGEDDHIQEILSIIKESNHRKHILNHSNRRLGAKINKGVSYAIDSGFDYIMNIGSDDLLHPILSGIYVNYINEGVKYFGLSSCYFYERPNKAYSFHYSQSHDYVVGAGRLISIEILKDVFFKYGGLYESERCKGMDSQSAKWIESLGYGKRKLLTGIIPLIVDIKSDTNITPLAALNQYNKNTFTINREPEKLLFDYFPILLDY